jgi:hypothetical protein
MKALPDTPLDRIKKAGIDSWSNTTWVVSDSVDSIITGVSGNSLWRDAIVAEGTKITDGTIELINGEIMQVAGLLNTIWNKDWRIYPQNNGYWLLSNTRDIFRPDCLEYRIYKPNSILEIGKIFSDGDISTDFIELENGDIFDIRLIPKGWSRWYAKGFIFRWKWGYWYLTYNENKERIAIFRKEEIREFWEFKLWVHNIPHTDAFDVSKIWYRKRGLLYDQDWDQIKDEEFSSEVATVGGNVIVVKSKESSLWWIFYFLDRNGTLHKKKSATLAKMIKTEIHPDIEYYYNFLWKPDKQSNDIMGKLQSGGNLVTYIISRIKERITGNKPKEIREFWVFHISQYGDSYNDWYLSDSEGNLQWDLEIYGSQVKWPFKVRQKNSETMIIESSKYHQGLLFKSNGEQIIIKDPGGIKIMDYARINYRSSVLGDLSITFLIWSNPIFKRLLPDWIIWETLLD